MFSSSFCADYPALCADLYDSPGFDLLSSGPHTCPLGPGGTIIENKHLVNNELR